MLRFLAAIILLGGLCLNAQGQEKKPPTRAEAISLPAQVNFSEHIAPIIFNNCASCHRPGEIGPFPLLSYKDVRKRGKLIHEVTDKRSMPPWHPAPGHGEFLNERRLSDEQLALIKRWVETDMTEGDPARLPKVPEFPDGWRLGKPDLIVTMEKAFEVPANGRDIYRNFALPLNLKEDQWLTAMELRPSAKSVVHHVLLFVDKSGRVRARDGQGGKPGFTNEAIAFTLGESIGGWAAGTIPQHRPMGLAVPIPKGADLVLQTHFHPSGKVEEEKTTIGLYFAKEKPTRTLVAFETPPFFGITTGINIPAGMKDYKIRGKFTAPVDIELVSVSGHAHYICETMRATATLPDGTKQSILYIPKWEFNWQSEYFYKEPVKLPKGTVIDVEISYNNSAENPANPFNPPRRIRWGIATTDEMGRLLFTCVPAKESDLAALRQVARTGFEGIVGSFIKPPKP